MIALDFDSLTAVVLSASPAGREKRRERCREKCREIHAQGGVGLPIPGFTHSIDWKRFMKGIVNGKISLADIGQSVGLEQSEEEPRLLRKVLLVG
jgi:hypothetical protein